MQTTHDLLLFATPNPSNCVRRFFHEKQNLFESLIEDMIILWFENRNCKSAVATIFEKKSVWIETTLYDASF